MYEPTYIVTYVDVSPDIYFSFNSDERRIAENSLCFCYSKKKNQKNIYPYVSEYCTSTGIEIAF